MKRSTLYRRAGSSVALPILLLLVGCTPLLDALLDRVLSLRYGGWLLAAAVIVFLFLEANYLLTLARLVRVGGSVAAFNALGADPAVLARRRRRRFRFVAAAFSTVLSLAAAEAIFRILDIRPAPPPRPSSFDDAEVDNTLNALGIREVWDALPADDKRLRVAFLGDSMVYGFSVEREDGFVHRIEGMLAADRPEGVVTINLGYPVSAPITQLPKYLALRDALRPDIVVHVVYLNDLGIVMHDRLKRIYRTRDETFVLGNTSRLLHYAEKQVRYWFAWRATLDYFRGGQSVAQRTQAWDRFKTGVRACKAAVEENGGTYAMVLFPWLIRLKDYPLADEHAHMRRFADELSVPYLDLLETFVPYRGEGLYISPMNEHATPLGHKITAERLARFLREEVFPHLRKRVE